MRPTNYNTMLRDFTTLADAMHRTFERNGYDLARNGGNNGNSEPTTRTLRLPIDVVAGDEVYTITAYLPGVQSDAVEITFEGEELTIRGEFPATGEETTFVKRELYRGAFERQLTFNVPINSDAIEASYQNGLLTLVVPKAEVVKPKQIKVVAK